MFTCEKAGRTTSVFPGVETIDVTAAGSSFLGLNHDIYVTNPAIFNDMRLVLELGKHPPDERSASFQPTATQGGTYWLYRRPELSTASLANKLMLSKDLLSTASLDKIALPVLAPRSNATADAPTAPRIEPAQPEPVPAVAAPEPMPQAASKRVEVPVTTPAATTPPHPLSRHLLRQAASPILRGQCPRPLRRQWKGRVAPDWAPFSFPGPMSERL